MTGCAAYADAEILAYVATGEPLDKAGAYAVQGLGGRLVAAVDGCLTNVDRPAAGDDARLLAGWGLLCLSGSRGRALADPLERRVRSSVDQPSRAA